MGDTKGIKQAMVALRTERLGRKISQTEFGEMIDRSLATIQKYESADFPLPSVEVLAHYCIIADSVGADDLSKIFRDEIMENLDQNVVAALFSTKGDSTPRRASVIEDIFNTTITVPRRFATQLKALAEFLEGTKTATEQFMADQIMAFANMRMSAQNVSDNKADERKPNGTHS